MGAAMNLEGRQAVPETLEDTCIECICFYELVRRMGFEPEDIFIVRCDDNDFQVELGTQRKTLATIMRGLECRP
jgi:hypothetical protein